MPGVGQPGGLQQRIHELQQQGRQVPQQEQQHQEQPQKVWHQNTKLAMLYQIYKSVRPSYHQIWKKVLSFKRATWYNFQKKTILRFKKDNLSFDLTIYSQH